MMREWVKPMDEALGIHFDVLPRSLQEVAGLVGLEAVSALVRHYAGSRVRVPRRSRPDHPLAACLGWEAMRRFCHLFGGEVLEVPRADGVRRRLRDREIVQLYDGGTPVRLLAKTYGLTERRIYYILNTTETNARPSRSSGAAVPFR
ncbi:MAG: hypothetical protein HQL51_02015 [Magnetococcales bacterium]|nr:hypothetical protein [Magnetococcales bacterium]